MKNKIINTLLVLSLLISNAAIPVFADNGADAEAEAASKTASSVLPKYAGIMDFEISPGENDSAVFTVTKKGDADVPQPVMFAVHFILSALGVDEDTIIQDFMLTNIFNANRIEGERKMLTERGIEGEELETLMMAMDEVSEQNMRNALDWMKENYGSVTGYITQALSITNEQLETLKNKYLE